MDDNKRQNDIAEERQPKKRLSYDDAVKNFEDAEVKQPKVRRNGWLGNLILTAIIVIGILLMFKMTRELIGEDVKPFDEVIAGIDLPYLLAFFAVLLAVFALASFKYSLLIRTLDGKWRFGLSVKVMFIGKYYDNVTPLTTGGQPMQIYYLHKHGFSGGKAGAVVFARFFLHVMIWLTVAAVLMLSNSAVLSTLDEASAQFLRAFGWIGWGVTAFMPIFVIVFTLLPRFAYKLTVVVVKLGAKLKIVKNKEKTIRKAIKTVRDFRASFVILKKSPLKLVLLVLACVVEVCAVFALPYFILLAFGDTSLPSGFSSFYDVMTLTAFSTFSVVFIPTPGNSGFVEGASTLAFRNVAASLLPWMVVTWRFAICYVYVLIGIVFTVVDMVKNSVKRKKENNEH